MSEAHKDADLLPCPFCGANDIQIGRGSVGERPTFYTFCNTCAAGTQGHPTRETSDEAWNRRAASPQAPAVDGAEALTCDFCGATTEDPWHTSDATRRHLHQCDACHSAAQFLTPQNLASAAQPVAAEKPSLLERVGEKIGLLTPIEPFYEKGDFGRETRELTFSQIQEIVTKAIGFEWSGGEMQTLNAPDLLKLAHAIIDAAKGVDHD